MKNLSIILSALLVIAIANTASGQTDPSSGNSILINLGADHLRMIDRAYTADKLKFTGTLFKAELSYQQKKKSYFLESSLLYSFGKISTSESLTSDFDRINLDISYARHLLSYSLSNMQNDGYGGIQIRSFNNAVSNDPVLENVSLSFYHTLNLLLMQTTRINPRNGLSLELSMPVLGWVKRSAYDGGANTELEKDEEHLGKLFFRGSNPMFLNPLTIPRVKLSFRRQITSLTDFTVSYSFNYLNDATSPPIRAYSNGLQAGLKFNF